MIRILITIVFLIGVSFGKFASGQNNELRECSEIHLGSEVHVLLKDLHKYAKIIKASNSIKRRWKDRWAFCPPVDNNNIPTPSFVPLPLSKKALAEIGSALRDFDGVQIWSGDYGSLSISCRGRDGKALPVLLKIFSYALPAGDYFDFVISFSPQILTQGDNGSSRVSFSPHIDFSTGDIVYIHPGTDLYDMEQIFANYIGEECAFPAISVAVSRTCEFFFGESSSEYFAISPGEIEEIRGRYSSQSTTVLAGHSLGGQAVQFVAENPPESCLNNRELSPEAFLAFAYASTRNSISNSPGHSTEKVILESYLIDGDQILQKLGLGQHQIGRVTKYYPNADCSGTLHDIVVIENSLSRCLNGQGKISINGEDAGSGE